MRLINFNIDEIIENLKKSENKDWRWRIAKVNDTQFTISVNILYLRNIGSAGGEPQNSLNLILEFVRDEIGVENLNERYNVHWEQVDDMFRRVDATFTLKPEVLLSEINKS